MMSAPVNKSKKEKRILSKQKKSLALIRLLEMKAAESDVEVPPAKKARLDERGCNTGAVTECRRVPQSRNSVKNGPKVHLTLENMLPFTNLNDEETSERGTLAQRLPPIFIVDLQHLLLLALLKNFSLWTPRWCRLMRPRKLSSVALVVLRDVSIKEVEDDPESFPFLKNCFLNCVEMVAPSQYNSTVETDLSSVPLLISQMKRYTNREDVREKVLSLISKPPRQPGGDTSPTAHCKQGQEEKDSEAEAGVEDEFPRTSLLLSSVQMMEEGYPLPVHTTNGLYDDYTYSTERYSPATHSSPMFGLDCEMCQTTKKDFELTRVSLVNEKKEVIYDQLVKPYNHITNYLTKFSGMTEDLLSPVTRRVEDVQRDLRNLLPPDAILCGQSIWNDLKVLKLFHPYVVDTSVVFNQSGAKNVKCGLRKLAYNFLGKKIQNSETGHCSIEDAKAAMDLVKLKLSRDIEFGDAMMGGVYYPNIKTYFSDPSKAQNVEETFSAHPVTTVLDAEATADTTDSHIQEQTERCAHDAVVGKPFQVVNGTVLCETETWNQQEELKSRVTAGSESGGQESEQDKQEEDIPNRNSKAWKESVEHLDKGRNQREVFFQQEGSTVKFSFCEVLADNKISSALVGSREFVSQFQSQPGLDCIVTENDEDTCSHISRVCQDRDFTWVELRAFADLVPLQDQNSASENASCFAEQRKQTTSQLDAQVEKIVSGLEERSLVAVVITGRSDRGQHFNAGTFLKMT